MKERERNFRWLKFLINIGLSGITGWVMLFSFFLWVTPPSGNSMEESSELLKSGIFRMGLEYGIYGVLIIFILVIITYKIERKLTGLVRLNELILILILNLFIVGGSLLFGMTETYKNLNTELEVYFNLRNND